MEKTLLFTAYAALSVAERREFGKFVRSPFFNQKPGLIALSDYLNECCEQGVSPNAESAWERIRPQKTKAKASKPDDEAPGVKLRLANSALLALLEHYWVYCEKFADSDRAKIRLAGAYRKRNLAKHFDITLREARRGREQQPWRTADYYHDCLLLEWEQYQWDSSAKRTEFVSLQATSDLMDTAFVARKLRLACLARAHQAVSNIEYELGLFHLLLNYLENNDLLQIPTIGLYFHCYHFLSDSTAATHFFRFKERLFAHADIFPEDELRTLYLLAINFSIKKTNEAQEGWLRDTLDLYQSALERQLLLENGYISRVAFNNIATIALRLGEVEWTEQFVQQHKSLLEKQHRESTAAFNLARVAYARRSYGAALLHLQNASDRNPLINLQAKTLQLKIFYQTGEWETLTSHLASMKIYLRRHHDIAYHREHYLRLLYYTKRLMELDFSKPAAVEKLRSKIEAEQILTEREWLLEQV